MNISYLSVQILILLWFMIIRTSSFRSYCIRRERFFKTKIFSKPTDNHEHLDVWSSHQQAVFRSIPRIVANRVIGEIVQMIVNL